MNARLIQSRRNFSLYLNVALNSGADVAKAQNMAHSLTASGKPALLVKDGSVIYNPRNPQPITIIRK
jgi:hypothetical protein